MCAPGVVTTMSPLNTVRAVPWGTPVLDGPGKPERPVTIGGTQCALSVVDVVGVDEGDAGAAGEEGAGADDDVDDDVGDDDVGGATDGVMAGVVADGVVGAGLVGPVVSLGDAEAPGPDVGATVVGDGVVAAQVGTVYLVRRRFTLTADAEL